jgi:hypothetical protein
MVSVTTQGNEILVDNPDEVDPSNKMSHPGDELVSWVVG